MAVKKKVSKVPKVSKVEASDVIQTEAGKLLELVGVEGTVSVEYSKKDELYSIQIETDSAAILIGHRGETLGAFQTILRQIVFGKTQSISQIIVNIGDWRAKREDTLTALASNASTRAKNTGQEQHLYDLSPSDRRFVHLLLSEDSGVSTESEGEGRDRHLVVKPK